MLCLRFIVVEHLMTEAYVIQNQHAHFLNKSGEWGNGQENTTLYRTLHKDEAINVKVEQSVRNPDLRLKVVTCALNAKGQPQIQSSEPALSESDTSALATPEVDLEPKESFSLACEAQTHPAPAVLDDTVN